MPGLEFWLINKINIYQQPIIKQGNMIKRGDSFHPDCDQTHKEFKILLGEMMHRGK